MNVDMTQMGTVVAIALIAYLFGIGFKLLSFIPDEAIPVLVGIVGGILGVVGMYVMPDFPANDILNAIAVGISSGIASTGINQIKKQITKTTE